MTRTIKQIIPARPASDGAGVKLFRSLGQSALARLDPFLMLDEFCSDNADDYIAGFPDHPHRGFETVTYMLDGHMLHQDHMGNQGDLKPGDVQWMTAGRGIIHSEMPQQESGRMRGFQLWINLPASEKMKPASYRDIPANQIPSYKYDNGTTVKVIAGRYLHKDVSIEGPIQGLSTDPFYVDITLPANEELTIPVAEGHHAFVYMFEGSGNIDGQSIALRSAAILNDGSSVTVTANEEGARLILLAGKPINEPIVQYGPFVMNTMEEIDQALQDYRDGTLASAV